MQNQFLFADQLVYFYHPIAAGALKKGDSEKADSRELFCVNSHH